MKKIQLSLLAMLASTVSFTSCSGSEENEEPATSSGSETNSVSFVPQFSGMARATETSFEYNDQIGVFAILSTGSDNKGVIAEGGNFADNEQYTYDGGKFVPTDGEGIVIPTNDGSKYYYHAVYPYTASAKNTFVFDVNTDQSVYANHTGSDLSTASTAATSETSVELKFSHRLSMVVINLDGDNWPSGAMTMTIKNAYTSALVDLNANSYVLNPATGLTGTDVICAENGTKSFKVILPPQTFLAGSEFAVLNIGGVDYPVTLSNNVELYSGKKTPISLTMDAYQEIVEFVGDINPWDTVDKIDDVVPDYIQDEMDDYITIHKGVNPPNIEGDYLIDPFITVYCEDQGNGGYDPGTYVTSSYIRFSNQNMENNTLDFERQDVSGSSYSVGEGAFISGSGNDFTAFFNTTGYTYEIYTKTALVISGTKTESGIANLEYAFVMVEKGEDPGNLLMAEGVFRVFKDEDGLAENYSWSRGMPTRNISELPGLFDYVKK